MFTNFQLVQFRFLEKCRNLQRLNFILAILTSFIGFFCGSISFTWLSRFFDWNGFIGLLILLFSEFIGLITPNRIKPEKQNCYSKSQVNRFDADERVFFLESDFSFSQVKEDTLKEDTLKEDTLKEDTLKEDTLKEDTLKEDTHCCLIYFRRGFLFALLADGFKVGS
jgi:hypothetical protein